MKRRSKAGGKTVNYEAVRRQRRKELGINVPQSLIARADELIE